MNAYRLNVRMAAMVLVGALWAVGCEGNAPLENNPRIIATSTVPVQSLAMSPDGRTLFVGWGRGTLESFEFKTGKKLYSFVGHTEDVDCLAVSPDGKMLASGSSDSTINLWHAVTGKEIRTLNGDNGWVTAVAFTPDGKKLLSGCGGEYDHKVLLWDVQTGKQEHVYEGEDVGPVVDIALSKDGKSILAATTWGGHVMIWDRKTGKQLRRIDFDGYRVAISPDQSRALSGCSPFTISGVGGADLDISDITTGNVIRTFSPDMNSRWEKVESLAFSADGKRFVSGVREGTVRIWNIETGDLMHALRLEGAVNAVLFSPDGSQVVAGGEGNKVIVWSLAKGQSTAKPRNSAG